MPLLDPLKPFRIFPMTGGDLTGLQFCSVTGSLYCHVPFLRDTAYIKSAFGNINKGFALSASFLLCSQFLGGTVSVLLATCQFPEQLTFQ